MTQLSEKARAQLILQLSYGDEALRCCDHYFCDGVNLWRDCFTTSQLQILTGLKEGDVTTLASGELLPVNPTRILQLRRSQWQPPGSHAHGAATVTPQLWRWYPQGFVHGVANIYPETMLPMRVTGVDENNLEVDCNHPLAGRDVQVTVTVQNVEPVAKERGGRCTDWLEEAMAAGPGMQLKPDAVSDTEAEPIPWPDYTVQLQNQGRRLDNHPDTMFYQAPRFVDHIDSTARSHLLQCTTPLVRSLTPGARVLDLMSSIQSHLPPPEAEQATSPVVVGLGMNGDELAANPALSEWLVQDLNHEPQLRFANGSFELVMCHLSIEYLLDPAKILKEVARVLTPGGKVIISFSNRWFPEKVTRLWLQLHEYERVGYVLYLLRDAFTNFQAETFRNWPRPADDAHYLEIPLSDPLFVITCQLR